LTPAASAGVVAVIVVLLITTTFVAGRLSMVIPSDVPVVFKFVPVIVTG
jgi:hypothetical protein